MSTRAALFVFVAVLLTATAPSFAQDVPSRPDDVTPCAVNECAPDVQRAPRGETPRMLAAEVVRIDERTGRVLLSTALGMVTVPASPDIIAQLSVGDLVVLRVVPDDDDTPSASPPTEEQSGWSPRGTRL
jgi:hypothetical protein